MGSDGPLAPLHQGIEHLGHQGRRHPEGSGGGGHPGPTALHPKGIGSRKQLAAAAHQGPRRGREEWLGQQHPGAGPNWGQLGGAPRRQARDHRNTQATKQLHQPVLHRIGQGADDQQLINLAGWHQGNHRQQGLVFSLGEGGFDAAAAVVQHHHPAGQLGVEPLGGLGQIQLDHLAGATTHQEQGADLGAPLQQILHQPVELIIGIGQAGQIPLPQNRSTETGFGKDHHAGGALNQVGASAGAHHQEKGIRHAPVQPHNRGEPAEHLPLTALLEQFGMEVINNLRCAHPGDPCGKNLSGLTEPTGSWWTTPTNVRDQATVINLNCCFSPTSPVPTHPAALALGPPQTP